MNKIETNELKQEYESLMSKLSELTDEELEQITGGLVLLPGYPIMCPICLRYYDFSLDEHFVFKFKYECDTGWPYVKVTCLRCGASYGYDNPNA